MFGFPKLVLIILVFAAVWWGVRWLNAVPHELPRRRPRPERPPRQQQRRAAGGAEIEAEDLLACGVCGAYVAASAPSCGRPDCPRPR
ncbi:MAG TPA: hypothetical protein VGR91_04565 [Stellaceae bacterium]|nr:hypothetical protein [Stellaceae bacterium]